MDFQAKISYCICIFSEFPAIGNKKELREFEAVFRITPVSKQFTSDHRSFPKGSWIVLQPSFFSCAFAVCFRCDKICLLSYPKTGKRIIRYPGKRRSFDMCPGSKVATWGKGHPTFNRESLLLGIQTLYSMVVFWFSIFLELSPQIPWGFMIPI